MKPLTRPKRLTPKRMGSGPSRKLQVYTGPEFRALMDAVAMRREESTASLVRRAVWRELKRLASPDELAEYRDALDDTG